MKDLDEFQSLIQNDVIYTTDSNGEKYNTTDSGKKIFYETYTGKFEQKITMCALDFYLENVNRVTAIVLTKKNFEVHCTCYDGEEEKVIYNNYPEKYIILKVNKAYII